MTDDLPQQLRARACPAGEPWTGDNPEEDHGHTDCWLLHQAADEIERLRALITAWAEAQSALDNASWDESKQLHAFAKDEAALRKAVGR